MEITSITTVLILTFAGIAGLPWPGTEGFVLSCSAQSMVKDFEQSHLIPPKMQTTLEISRQAELSIFWLLPTAQGRSFLRHCTRRCPVKAATVDFAPESVGRLLEQPFSDRPAAFHCSHAETWRSRQLSNRIRDALRSAL
jgi:hypothetical protein